MTDTNEYKHLGPREGSNYRQFFIKGDAVAIALGALQVVYGILAWVVLIRGRAEFARLRVD
jgi:hypothetical protein